MSGTEILKLHRQNVVFKSIPGYFILNFSGIKIKILKHPNFSKFWLLLYYILPNNSKLYISRFFGCKHVYTRISTMKPKLFEIQI